MINRLILQGERVSRVAAWAGGIILFLISILITVEVILRKLFSISMGGADEISSYALAASSSFGFSYALFQKAHIRIDVLYTMFSQWMRHILDVLSLILLGTYMLVLSYYGFQVFWISFLKGSTANTPLHTPLWIPQLIWLLGLWGFTLCICLLLFGTLVSFFKKDSHTAQKLAGTTDLKEKIDQESIAAPGGDQ